MGNQASTLMSLLTLKEAIRAQNQPFYVSLRHHNLSQTVCCISLSFTLYAQKFLIFQTLVLLRLFTKAKQAMAIQIDFKVMIGIK